MEERSASIHDLDRAPEPDNETSPSLSSGRSSKNLSPIFARNKSGLPRSPPQLPLMSTPYSPAAAITYKSEDDNDDSHDFGDDESTDNEIVISDRRVTAPGRLEALDSNDLSSTVGDSKTLRRVFSETHQQSGWSEGLDDDDEDAPYLSGDEEGSEFGNSSKAFVVLGVSLPQWCTRGPSWNRIASFVVRRAPCFLCSGSALELGATDRSILYRLNVLCSFFAAGQIIAGIFLVTVLFSRNIVQRDDEVVNRKELGSLTPNLWNINGSIFLLAIIGFFCLVSMVYTLGVIREVNLVGSLRYMWIMVWLLPLQIFVVISVVDYHRVTGVWVRHWWSVQSLAWFRAIFCEGETANTRCIVPVLGGTGFQNEDEWCMATFNSTDCEGIRESAQARMLTFAYFFYNMNFVWGLVLVMLLVLAVNVLEGIVTKPVVQSSRESNVPAWLTLPTIGSLAIGLTFLYGQSSVLSAQTAQNWVGVLFLTSGGLFLVAALLGRAISAVSILNSRDKQNKKIGVLLFISLMAINATLIAAIFVSSILLSTSLVEVPLSDEERGRLACLIDGSSSCTLCDNDLGLRACPEWEENEVVRVLQTQLKQSGTVAAIFWLYAIGALRFGLALRKHITRYEINYV